MASEQTNIGNLAQFLLSTQMPIFSNLYVIAIFMFRPYFDYILEKNKWFASLPLYVYINFDYNFLWANVCVHVEQNNKFAQSGVEFFVEL